MATTEEPVAADGAAPGPAPKRFGTLAGVFTHTLVTILGVIMFLRLPWVVGNAGLRGGWLIMAIALGVVAGMQALKSALFKPNLLVLTVAHGVGRDERSACSLPPTVLGEGRLKSRRSA